MIGDLRYALRQLRASPTFAVAAVLTLALGIGATTAVFSVAHAVLFRPLPYLEPDRLVRIWESHPEWSDRNLVSTGSFMDWRDGARTFEALGAHGGSFGVGITGDGDPVRVPAVSATPGLFRLLGVRAAAGRLPSAAGEADGRPDVVLGHGLWTRRFGGDPAVVGRELRLDEDPYRIVGVLPAGFDFPSPAIDVWFPARFDEEDRAARQSHRWRVVGRLADGVGIEAARAEMERIAVGLRERHPEHMAGWDVRVLPFRADLVREVRPALLVLLGMVGLVLLVACGNVANLMLARTVAREREMAVRGALGASRWRLLRQLLVESGTLALVGGGIGVALAAAGLDALVALAPSDIPLLDDTRIDAGVLAFAAAATLAATLLFGLAPALQGSRSDPADPLRVARGMPGPRHARMRAGLLAGQVALALVLLAGAGLLVRSFLELRAVDHGFEAEGLLAVSLDVPGSRYPDAERRAAFYERLLERIEAVPGVVGAAGTPEPPVVGYNNTFGFVIEGRPRPGADPAVPPVEVRAVTPGYLETMRIPLLRGRPLRASDREDAPLVAVVNESLARRDWAGDDPLGKRITFDDEGEGPWVEIVGVAGDTRHYGLERPPEPALYIPNRQKRWGWMSWMTLLVRVDGDAESLAGAVEEAVWELDDRLPIHRLATVPDLYAESRARRRFVTTLLGGLAGLALALGAVGVYGVVAYTVSQRRREIGIRRALGARRGALAAAVLRRGLGIAAAGIAAGTLAGLAAARLLGGLLYEVPPTDPVAFAAAAGLLGSVAALASWLPARRAARTDPMTVLREE